MTPDKEYNGRARIRMYNCDCMDLMKTGTWGLAIVDPPYGIDINSSGRLGHYGGKGKNWDSELVGSDYFKILNTISENQIVWGANYYSMPPTRCFLLWDKMQPEGISFASHEFAWASFNQSAKCFYMRPQNADNYRIHPTQKPVQLYKWLLTNYAKPGQTIFDSHGGSMSIAIACWDLGFDLDICELDKDYFDAAFKRFENHISQQVLF